MRFADKLSFLIHITGATNKELAAELSVDPSMVSLMRTGKRNPSKKNAQIKKMALFFAKRSSAEYQRHALSEMLGQRAISRNMPTEALASCLENWLQGDPDIVSDMLEGFQTASAGERETREEPPVPVSENKALFFYGEGGRREAMCRVMREIRSMETPCTILVTVDDNLEWLLSDYLLTKQVQADLLAIMESGFTFCQIMPPLNYINRFSESLKFWLPMYATGQMKIYYYPRLRGNLFRHSTIIVPGRCVQYSSTVGQGNSSDITMFSSDPTLVAAFEKQFQTHLSLCRPALAAHSDPRDFIPCFLDIFSRPGDTIQMVNPLSVNSIPQELLERCIKETDNPGWKTTFQMYLEEIPHFEERLKQGPYIDMSRLATVEEIRTGKVYVASAFPTYPNHPRYTPETYILHLQNILRLMDQYENYFFLPSSAKEQQDYNLIVNEGGLALLIRTQLPPLMLEFRRPELVIACQEHLLRKADRVGCTGIQREKIRKELQALIRELRE